MHAALLAPDAAGAAALVGLARDFSPRYEWHGRTAIVLDVGGLGRLFGEPRAIGNALMAEASRRGVRLHVALARTWTAALVLVHGRPGLTVVLPGGEAAALAPLKIDVLEAVASRLTGEAESLCSRPRDTDHGQARGGGAPRAIKSAGRALELLPLSTFAHWGLRTLGELAALPDAALVARLGRPARVWQTLARGEDVRPIVPALDEERFEASMELEWPIEGQEPLSFVLTRLLEPLSTRLERRDRGAAVLHVRLQLVTRAAGAAREVHARRLELPSPIRDVRTLRTLALLDLESHPPEAAVHAVTVFIEPTPARVLQHTLFTRAQPQPERMATLVARLNALMGQDRVGTPVAVDSFRPGVFAMAPFTPPSAPSPEPSALLSSLEPPASSLQPLASSLQPLASALRRCRPPVAARIVVNGGRPVHVSTDCRAFGGGAVCDARGPWRTSGEWWAEGAGRESTLEAERQASVRPGERGWGPASSERGWGPRRSQRWDRDEWDVVVADGTRYRVFQDRETARWFIDAVID